MPEIARRVCDVDWSETNAIGRAPTIFGTLAAWSLWSPRFPPAIMYTPRPFQVTDRDELLRFVSQHAFGQLISEVDGELFATHIPFILNAERTALLGHVAKQNPHWRGASDRRVLLTFLGEHGYVSPSWYASPGVPTWNYQAVHVYGRCRVFTDAERLRDLLAALTERYESAFSTPWQPRYPPQALSAIVGLAVEITTIQGKYKLSQNRPVEDRRRVAEKFASEGHPALARAMQQVPS